MMRFSVLIGTLLLVATGNAHAYVGPGLGLGAIGALIGVIAAILLALVGVVWYPIKRMLKKRNPKENDAGKK